MADTGFAREDAQTDFRRARRSAGAARLARKLLGRSGAVNVILPFEEVVTALGRMSERELGRQTIALDSIVGTVDRRDEFDRRFRPTTRTVRSRWERMAVAMRKGEGFPPISVYRIGELHFVRDGHHRVSVSRALGREVIEAYVTEVTTRLRAPRELTVADLPMRSHRRLFLERVPLDPSARREVRLTDEWRYAELAEGVEAWAFRTMQEREEVMDRREAASAWYREEFTPVVELLREAGLQGSGTSADAYLHVANERYRLLRTHEWSTDVIDRLARELD